MGGILFDLLASVHEDGGERGVEVEGQGGVGRGRMQRKASMSAKKKNT